MDVNMTTSSTAAGAYDSVGISMLKKAIDIEAQGAQLLIDSLPQPTQNASNLPPNLGQNINTSA